MFSYFSKFMLIFFRISYMKKQVFYLLVFIITFFTSCTEEGHSPYVESIDTIFPNSYLPAYPNSYWIYSNGDTSRTFSSYVLDTIEKPVYTGYFYNIDHCEFYERAFYPVYDNNILRGYTLYFKECSTPEKLLDEELGKKWENDRYKTYYISREVKAKDIQVTLPNTLKYENVIIIEEEIYSDYVGFTTREYYYAKNIGLIKSRIIKSGFDTVDVCEKYLLEYTIGN